MHVETIEPKKREPSGPEAVTPPAQTEFPTEFPQKKDLRDSTPAPTEEKSLDHKNIQEAEIDRVSNALEQFWDAMGVSLKFKVDKRTETIQVEIIDPSSDKVIKKIPADEILNMAASLKESVGFLVDRDL
ncbi:flagellar protein FlaG [Desulfoplanes sp.]